MTSVQNTDQKIQNKTQSKHFPFVGFIPLQQYLQKLIYNLYFPEICGIYELYLVCISTRNHFDFENQQFISREFKF